MEKIIYKVNVCHMADGTVKFISAVNRKQIGLVNDDYFNKGKYVGTAMLIGTITNADFTDAVQYVHDRIREHFAEYGIETEFIESKDMKKRMYQVSTTDHAGNFYGLFSDFKNGAFITENYEEALEKFNEECEKLRQYEEQTGGAHAIENDDQWAEHSKHSDIYSCSIYMYDDDDDDYFEGVDDSRLYLIYGY